MDDNPKHKALLWKTVVNEIPLRIYAKDVDNDMRYAVCSKLLSKQLDVPASEFLGRTAREIFPKKAADVFEQTSRKTLEMQSSHTEEECDYTPRNDTHRHLLTTETLFTLPDGSRYIAGYSFDNTEEIAVIAVERAIYDISSIPIYEGDFLQEVFNVLTRKDRLDVVEMRWQTRDLKTYRTIRSAAPDEPEVYKPSKEDFINIWKFHREKLDKKGVVFYTDLRKVVTGVSEEFKASAHNHVAVLAIKDRKGAPVGEICCFLREWHFFSQRFVEMLNALANTLSVAYNRIVMLRELELQLARVQETERKKSYFFASVSHDIRTPLNSIIGFSELLKDDHLDNETRTQYVEAIASSGHILLQLVNDTLALAKLESGKIDVDSSYAEFGRIVKEITMSFLPSVQSKGIAIKNDIAPNFPYVGVDHQRIRQVLFNLVGNAVKFTEKGYIEIKARFEPDPSGGEFGVFSFDVIDTGRGITQEGINRLKQPFMQLMNSDRTNGTGLGLAICRQFVEKMGGQISIRSELGKGSVFRVQFNHCHYSYKPPKNSLLSRTQRIKIMPEHLLPKQKRILIVDDVMLNLHILKTMLQKLGVEQVETATCGRKALEILYTEGKKFDYVLTDMWMPEIGGAELIARIRSDRRFDSMQVYAVTADAEVLKTYKAQGFTGILLKPVTIKSLSQLLPKMRPAPTAAR